MEWWYLLIGMAIGAFILGFGILFGAAIVVGTRPKNTEDIDIP